MFNGWPSDPSIFALYVNTGCFQPAKGIRPLSTMRTSPSTPAVATVLSILAANRIRHVSSTFRSASTFPWHSESRC